MTALSITFKFTAADRFTHSTYIDICDVCWHDYHVPVRTRPTQEVCCGTDWKKALLDKASHLDLYENLVHHDNNIVPLPMPSDCFKKCTAKPSTGSAAGRAPVDPDVQVRDARAPTRNQEGMGRHLLRSLRAAAVDAEDVSARSSALYPVRSSQVGRRFTCPYESSPASTSRGPIS